MEDQKLNRISIHVTPTIDRFAVEKAVGDGKKGRYLCGIASGLAEDAHGEIRLSDTVVLAYKISDNDCWNVQDRCTKGIGYIAIHAKGLDSTAHRAVYKKYKGDIPEGLVVRHSCDNPACVNPEHLLLGTVQDNVQDMVDRDRHAKTGIPPYHVGETHPAAKLTEEQVREILKRYEQDEDSTIRGLAREFHISQRQMQRIVRRLVWKIIK